MTVMWWRRRLIMVVGLVAACVAAGCSGTIGGKESGLVGSSGTSPAAIAITTTPLFITVENRAGLPLVDVKVVLQTAGGMAFSTLTPRMESGAKRDISLGDLRSRDGTSYSRQLQRPKQVLVTATDVVGKKYELTVPWK